MMTLTYEKLAKEAIETLNKTLQDDFFKYKVLEISQLISLLNEKNKLVCIFGNGGSAADAQHFAAELVSTYKRKDRKPYKAIALTTDSSIITACSNDFNYESIFTRQIKAFKEIVGLSIGLSTSGKSKNVLDALNYAKKIGSKTCLICGDNEIKSDKIDIVIKVPSKNTGTIQTITQVLYHSICEVLEES